MKSTSHEVGCGAELIGPGDPRYMDLSARAVHDEDLNGTAEQNAALADRWRSRWALEERRTA